MHKLTLISLVWVAYATRVRRQPRSTLHANNLKGLKGLDAVTSSYLQQSNLQLGSKSIANSLRTLAMFLLGGSQAAAFTPIGLERHFLVCDCIHTQIASRMQMAPKAAAETQDLPTIVVGGGIVGLTAAYYLIQKGRPVTIVEKCAIACHSSGKAGGFLTDGDSGWHASPIAHLAKHSFALHEELAQEFGAEKIGYRRVRCVGRSEGGRSERTPEWLADGFESDMGDESTLAQVTPYKLMDELHAKVTSEGAKVVIAKVTGVQMEEGTVSAINVEHDSKQWAIPCSALILAMGPWAKDAASWFPGSAMPRNTVSSRYTSVIWDDTRVGKDATMIFVSGPSKVEIYPRSNEAYANGCPTSVPLPDDPLEITPPQEQIDNIKDETVSAVERLKEAKVIRSTACFLPISEDGNPVIGHVPNINNAIISCAGGCWGILNGPAMGQAAADLASGSAPAVDLTPFDPARLEEISKIGATLEQMGLPSKLSVLVAQKPFLLDLIKQNPEVADQLASMV